jgi:hypothetical protein
LSPLSSPGVAAPAGDTFALGTAFAVVAVDVVVDVDVDVDVDVGEG